MENYERLKRKLAHALLIANSSLVTYYFFKHLREFIEAYEETNMFNDIERKSNRHYLLLDECKDLYENSENIINDFIVRKINDEYESALKLKTKKGRNRRMIEMIDEIVAGFESYGKGLYTETNMKYLISMKDNYTNNLHVNFINAPINKSNDEKSLTFAINLEALDKIRTEALETQEKLHVIEGEY